MDFLHLVFVVKVFVTAIGTCSQLGTIIANTSMVDKKIFKLEGENSLTTVLEVLRIRPSSLKDS